MPRFSTNISVMFTEHDFFDRFQAARDAGFAAVEMQFPYEYPVDAIAAAREKAGIGFVVFNFPVGDMREGGPGLAAMPGREEAFRDAVAQGRLYAEALDTRNINILAGYPPPELGRERCVETMAGNVAHAAAAMAEIGVRVTIEAVNTRDRPGYFLSRTAEALEVLDKAGHANTGLEHDLYHMQIMEGDLLATIERHLDRIGHFQFADTPGRHEPGTGEINFPFLFEAIDRLGYDGMMGAEYAPTGTTADSLGWLKPYL